MSLALLTVTNSIAALTVTGVTIKDVDEIPQTLTDRDCPMLIPDPEGLITGFEMLPKSWGVGSARAWDANYTLHYLLISGAAGMGRTKTLEGISNSVTQAVAVISAVLATTTLPLITPSIGDVQVIDIAGTSYHAIDITFEVYEIVQ